MTESTAEKVQEERRDLLKWLLGGSLVAWIASVAYPILAYLQPPKQNEVAVQSIKAGKLSEIELDSGRIVKFGTKPVILIRTNTNELKAFTATCTHLDCTVQYSKEKGIIWCACHNGQYDLTGRNIGGPPPKPLEEFRVLIQEDEVLISKNT
ncbi:MAG: hypothetical protein A2X67_07260 [Ignavibacteria bacterium GWA2_55_11]|nr:MAG: hypothetical protein A2X67_07260 [Ignavibacteria bacterium GWA2_55_11]OGU43670.1 MAG: hypothetical protein A2X68_06565 [Ignavibacteria bacterium GWC2_56_12]OGU63883.1 MAG: hypothetical protein A3C56_06120 [Ignavibacteria bacterium RIFCSPHIGHO2_02_FULL_56_12]OGU69058.1 MAG: hypothetical protein A3H45_04115 [Ignavibacteria bacterium RIFCSPLOWO2_02_FULL_55_14]OGU76438.1 MAG: hypothetical protein A3G43_00335 [Ignavibacteria bacterium RIFCSPLOWO2_12_FULL_56_21]